MLRRAHLLLLASAVGVFTAGWLWMRQGAPQAGAPGTPPYLTVILIDGLSQEHFVQLTNANRLPNLAALSRQGTTVKHGISAFPTMTGYGFYPFLTAKDATTSGLLGLRWFDRGRRRGQIRNYVGRSNVHMNEDLVESVPTLFERVAPQHSFSINALVDRGVVYKVMTGWDFTMAKYQRRWWLPKLLSAIPVLGRRWVPDLAEAERRVLAHAVADLDRKPKIQWVSFTAPDAFAHIHGMSEGYDDLLEHVDGLIGAYREASRAAGTEDDRIYAVITDHGLVNVARNVDLRGPLAARGLRVDREEATKFWQAGLDENLTARLAATDAVLLVNGNSLNYLYFRNPQSKSDSGDFSLRVPREALVAYPGAKGRANVIESVLAVEGVEHVVSRTSSGEIVIEKTGGRGVIRQSEGALSYEAVGLDPLGYDKHSGTAALMDGNVHPKEAWLAASLETEFPDAIFRLDRLLHQEGCGDLVVLGQAGFDLARDYERFVSNYRGGHGGLRAAELRVPYILAGPGVPSGQVIESARAEDVGATLHVLLQQPLPPGAEGQPLFFPAR